MSSADLHFQKLLDFVTSPEGAALVLVGVMLALIGTQKPTVAWGFLVAATLTASLAQSTTLAEAILEEEYEQVLAPGLLQLQSYGRIIAIAGLVGAVPYVLSGPRSEDRFAGPRAINVYLLLFQAAIVVKFLEYRLVTYAVLGGVIYGLLFFVFGMRQTTWVPDWTRSLWPIRAVAVATALFILGVLYQATVNASVMTGNSGRLEGLTSNPQHAATLLAAGLPAICCIWEMDRRNPIKLWGYLALMALCVLLIAWTSSRTGGVMCVAAIAVMYRRRMQKLAVVSLLCLGVLLAVAQYSSEISDTTDLLIRSDDTRSQVWLGQINAFMQYPLTGEPRGSVNRLGIGENSWLSAASAMGVMGLVPLGLFGLAVGKLCLRCNELSRWAGEDTARIADAVMAGFASLAVGSVFEGYLLGVLNFQVFAIGLYAMAGYACVELAETQTDEFEFAEVSSGTSEALPFR